MLDDVIMHRGQEYVHLLPPQGGEEGNGDGDPVRNGKLPHLGLPFMAHMVPGPDTPNLSFIGGWFFIIGSLFYLGQGILAISSEISWQNVLFLAGTIMYLAGSCLFTLDSGVAENSSNLVFLRKLRRKSHDHVNSPVLNSMEWVS